MTPTDELREAVALLIDPDAYTVNNTWFILSALDTADRIIRLVVEACAREAERAGRHPVGAGDGGTYTVGTAIDAARAISALAPKEPAP